MNERVDINLGLNQKINYNEIRLENGARVPLLESKNTPNTYYYATFGFQFTPEDFAKGIEELSLPKMDYVSHETFKNCESIPDSILADMPLDHLNFRGRNGKAGAFAQMYLPDGSGFEKEVTIYRLTPPKAS